ncbi:MAG TPA: hypothetical protein VGS78_13200 [Candidatus Sulfotelmatobacter sp.]|nr:hypothetical protein [Candidatus Sulfotelmatobacter sp.]
MPISAVDTIPLAFQHTKRQLLQPFRFGQWTRLAIVGLLAGEMGSGSGNFSSPFKSMPHQAPPSMGGMFPGINLALIAALVSAIVVLGFIIALVFLYISSVMRFILFDSVLTRECRIRDGWSRRQGTALNYFWWQLGYGIVMFLGVVVIVGIPAAVAFGMGWFAAPHAHMEALILTGVAVFAVFCFFMIAAVLGQVLTKDFVIPQMALEDIGPIEAWRRLWPMIEGEFNSYAMYVLMKIVLAIGAGIIIGIAALIVAAVVAVPIAGVVIAAVLAGKSAGLTWNVLTITGAVVVGCIVLAILFYVIALVSVPAIVFFPAYSIYFFAPRYRPLSVALYPPPNSPLSPLPQPAG